MPATVQTASLPKRSIAYLIDSLLILIPVACGVTYTALFSFTPNPIYGWLTIAVLACVTFGILLAYAAQNAVDGQTLGKRITGIRVLRAESLKTTDFADALARGSTFLLGVAGLGIAPIFSAIRRQQHPDQSEWTSWPHRLDGSRVVDIKNYDPLHPQQENFPNAAAEWISAGQQAKVTEYPPPAPQWSPAYQGQTPVLTRQEAPPVRRNQVRTQLKASAQSPLRPWWGTLGRALLSLTTVMAVVALFSWAGGMLQPTAPHSSNPNEVLTASLTTKLPVEGYTGTGFPGYNSTPNWTFQTQATAAVSADESNVYIFDNRILTILDSATGKKATTIPLNQEVDITAPTVFAGKSGYYWASNGTAHGWYPGSKGPDAGSFSAPIPKGATPYTAGAQLLFVSAPDAQGNYGAWAFGAQGFTPLYVPAGYIPGSISDGTLVSTNLSGTVQVSRSKTDVITTYPLQAPKDNVSFAGTIAAGYGMIVALWSPLPDSTANATPVTIATYDAASGALKSFINVTRQQINTAPSWIWGSDGIWADFAGYVFDVKTGRPILDLTAQNVKPIAIVGSGILGEGADGNVYLTKQAAYSISGVVPLATNSRNAIVKTKSGLINRFTSN